MDKSGKIIFKSTFQGRGKYLNIFYTYFLIDVLFVLFLLYYYGNDNIVLYILVACGMFLFSALPTYILHYIYYQQNKNDILVIDTLKNEVEYTHNQKSDQFMFSDIDLIKYYKPPALIENRTGWLPFDSYSYAKIILNSNTEIIITCLLTDDLKIQIDNSKIKLIESFYPLIKK